MRLRSGIRIHALARRLHRSFTLCKNLAREDEWQRDQPIWKQRL